MALLFKSIYFILGDASGILTANAPRIAFRLNQVAVNCENDDGGGGGGNDIFQVFLID